MGYIAIDSLVADMTPEQKILVQQFYSKFDVIGNGANSKIVNIEPLFYQGVIAGTEFLTYDATKLYLVLSCSFGGSPLSTSANPIITLYDENNVASLTCSNVAHGVYYDTVALLGMVNNVASYLEIHDSYFARFLNQVSITQMKFIGYRITLI